MKLSEFVGKSNISEKLIRSTVRQIGGWTEFQEIASDVANHGANTGWGGFTYYKETYTFTKRNLSEIMEMAKSQAEDLGEADEFKMISGFRCLNGDFTASRIAELIYRRPKTKEDQDDQDLVFNALAWYALEEVSREYDDIA